MDLRIIRGHETTNAHTPNAADSLKGLVAGTVGGLVGAWAMNRFHALVSQLSHTDDDDAQQAAEQEPGDAQAAERGRQTSEREPSTVLAAEAISQRVLHHELTPREKELAGPVMHYGFGATAGAAYGVTAEHLPAIRIGQGSGYGLLVWVLADETAVPLLGLSDPPTHHTASEHLSGLGAHLAFGLVAESVRRAIRMCI